MAKSESPYVQQVLQARSALAQAKSDYNNGVAKAKKNVKEAQELYDKRIKSLKSDKAKVEKDFSDSIKSYSSAKLYNDRLEYDGHTLKFEYGIQADVVPVTKADDTKALYVTFTSGEATLRIEGDPEKEETARDFASAVKSAQANYPEKLRVQNERIALLTGELEAAMNATQPIREAERRLDEATAQSSKVTWAEGELHRIEASGSPTDKELLKQTQKSKRKTSIIIVAGVIIVVLVIVLVVFLFVR
jgi:hypothetical protein